VNDPVTGITIGELNILQAASLIPGKSEAQKPARPAAHPVVNPTPVNTSDSTLGMGSPVTTPVTTFVTTASSTQVFVNGQQIDSGGTTLSAWAASDSGQSVPAATQVQIWNA
jgi:hypothetical protein